MTPECFSNIGKRTTQNAFAASVHPSANCERLLNRLVVLTIQNGRPRMAFLRVSANHISVQYIYPISLVIVFSSRLYMIDVITGKERLMVIKERTESTLTQFSVDQPHSPKSMWTSTILATPVYPCRISTDDCHLLELLVFVSGQ